MVAPEAAEGDVDPVEIDRYADELPGKPHVFSCLDMGEVKVGPDAIAHDIADSHVDGGTQ